jgi:cobalt transporter subunit CbtA
MLTRVVLAALVAGLLAGAFATAAQSVRVIPLIHQAETYENAVPHADAGHSEHEEAWAPRDGWQRTFFTLLSNLVVGVAFSLILTAAILLLDQPMSLQHGLAWGAGGFAVFVLAPNFGLPPELPGMAAGDLVARQIWWFATVALTAGGLLIFAFRRSLVWMVAGVALVVAPHVYGAPQPASHASPVPAGLAAEFVIATVVTSALFWLVLGGLLGHFLSRAIKAEAAAGQDG